VQVFELADELGVCSADVLELADAHGLPLETGADELTEEQVARLRGAHEYEVAVSSGRTAPPPYAGDPPPPGGPAWAPGQAPPAPGGPTWAPGQAPPPPGGPAWSGQVPPPPGLPGYPAGPPVHPADAYGQAPPAAPQGGYGPAPAWPGSAPPPPHSILLAPGQAPPPGYVIEGAPRQMRSQGTHPLIKSSLWYLLGGHVVPCVGPFLMIRAYQLAGQGRLHVQWSRGRYSGEGVGQAVQIYCWIYLALVILAVILVYGGGNATAPPPTTGF